MKTDKQLCNLSNAELLASFQGCKESVLGRIMMYSAGVDADTIAKAQGVSRTAIFSQMKTHPGIRKDPRVWCACMIIFKQRLLAETMVQMAQAGTNERNRFLSEISNGLRMVESLYRRLDSNTKPAGVLHAPKKMPQSVLEQLKRHKETHNAGPVSQDQKRVAQAETQSVAQVHQEVGGANLQQHGEQGASAGGVCGERA